jgi:hypothetical protein
VKSPPPEKEGREKAIVEAKKRAEPHLIIMLE